MTTDNSVFALSFSANEIEEIQSVEKEEARGELIREMRGVQRRHCREGSVVSMDKNFHAECYSCAVCDVILSPVDGYLVDGHLLCGKCNNIRRTSVEENIVDGEVSTEL